MAINVGKEITALRRLTVPQLRRRYAEVSGEDTQSRHKEFLIRRIVWRLQANDEGGVSDRAMARARDLAAQSDVRLTEPRPRPAAPECETTTSRVALPADDRLPMPGTVITRRYKNQTIEVRVLPRGFEFEGEVYRSLSAVAKQVTGTHWNGFQFFRVGGKGASDGR